MRPSILAAALVTTTAAIAQSPDNDAKLRAWVQPVSGAQMKRTRGPAGPAPDPHSDRARRAK